MEGELPLFEAAPTAAVNDSLGALDHDDCDAHAAS